MSNKENKEFDQDADVAGFIVPFEEKKKNKTQLCNVEEDALQICVLNNKGLSGCQKEMEKYNQCRSKEFSSMMMQQNKQFEREARRMK